VLDGEVGPGKIVCCAAGNEGNDNIHARVEVGQDHVRTISFAVPPPAPGQPSPTVALNGWYSGRDELALAVAAPGASQTPFQPVLTGQSPVGSYELPGGAVRIVTPGPDPANGDHNFLVEVQPAPAPAGVAPKPGAWRLRVRGDKVTRGTVDVWSVDETAAQLTGPAVQDSLKVGAPGSATEVVTVGSYTTKVDWDDMMGNPHQAGLHLDDVSDFSSEGPRRDGAEKPDLLAPGAMIASSLSTRAPASLDELVDDLNVVKAGTSMAAPFVSGLVALLLERDHTLGPQQVKDLLRAHCSIPRHHAGGFDAKWGHGLIHAEAL
jgi:subtilisin family serine protease